jgi:hypothetical protein
MGKASVLCKKCKKIFYLKRRIDVIIKSLEEMKEKIGEN